MAYSKELPSDGATFWKMSAKPVYACNRHMLVSWPASQTSEFGSPVQVHIPVRFKPQLPSCALLLHSLLLLHSTIPVLHSSSTRPPSSRSPNPLSGYHKSRRHKVAASPGPDEGVVGAILHSLERPLLIGVKGHVATLCRLPSPYSQSCLNCHWSPA